jgi:inhibitor of the pro-sigma K processing machinery
MDTNTIIMIAIAGLAIFLTIKIIGAPIKLGVKFLLNAVMGWLLLLLCNFLGAIFGYTIPVTWITASIAGLFGFPGVLAMFVYFIFF